MTPPRSRLGLALAVAALPACGGGGGPRPPNAPAPLGTPAVAGDSADPNAILWRLPAELLYEVVRRDSLLFGAGPARQAQVSGKRAYLRVRQVNAGVGVEVLLDSVAAQAGSQIAPEAIDSTRGARWTGAFTPRGPLSRLLLTQRTVLTEQLGQVVDLLLPQLPEGGLKPGSWNDSLRYQLRVDAFEANERVTGASTAVRVPPSGAGSQGGFRVTGQYRLAREGYGSQSGQSMRLDGGGERSITYNFSEIGRLYDLTARDSLGLTVTLLQSGQVIPVRWHTVYSAVLRSVRER